MQRRQHRGLCEIAADGAAREEVIAARALGQRVEADMAGGVARKARPRPSWNRDWKRSSKAVLAFMTGLRAARGWVTRWLYFSRDVLRRGFLISSPDDA
jgi:hypothetical protein